MEVNNTPIASELFKPQMCQIHLVSVLKGCAFGVGEALFTANVAFPVTKAVDWHRLDQSINGITNIQIIRNPNSSGRFIEHISMSIIQLTTGLIKSAGLPIFKQGRTIGIRKDSETEVFFSVAIPYAEGAVNQCYEAFVWASNFLCLLLKNDNDSKLYQDAVQQKIDLMKRLESKRLPGTNTLRFLLAANNTEIPINYLTNNIYQYGWGIHQCWSNSSIFDTTSTIAVSIARDKSACISILRQAGLPVPDHSLASTLESAKKIADRLGYPVVIKPSNLDGGVGVAAGLQNVEQLENAWAHTIKLSRSILVEKHQDGEDYRVIVFDGQMIWAVGRQPAGVTGDGKLNILELVEKTNQDPSRGMHALASLRHLQLDEEAVSLLMEEGCTVETILVEGRFVRFRRSSNISSGGTPLVVTDEIHSDNRLLVERAVNLLKLDVAGVDLIIPDIRVSWRESGAAIIEVNAQPQLVASSQTHLYGAILKQRVVGNGRIPVMVIVGKNGQSFVDSLLAKMDRSTLSVGVASQKGAKLGNFFLGRESLSVFDAGKALLMQRDTAVLVIIIDDVSSVKAGLPVDFYDTLVVLGSESDMDKTDIDWITYTMAMVAPNCTNEIFLESKALMARLEKIPLRSSAKSYLVNHSHDMFTRIVKRIDTDLGL